jgi:hypothetical protein
VLGLTVAAGLGFCLCAGIVALALYWATRTQTVAVVAPPAGATGPDPEVVPPPERPPEFPGDRPGGPGKAADAPPDPRGPAPNPDAIRDGRFVRPGAARSPTFYLRAVSTKGDYIGAGQTFNVGKGGMTLAVTRRGVTVAVPGLGLSFGGPRDTFLTAGQYRDARRLPFSGDAPGIEITTPGRGCNTIHGSFAVWEIEVAGNRVTRLAIDFVQHCEGAGPPLYGSVRFNSAFK